MLLILVQKNYRCINTPLIYKPPTPTQSPEYLEALNTLYQHLFSHHEHHYGGEHHVGHDFGHGYGTGSYGFGHDISHGYGTNFGHKFPTIDYDHKPSYGHGNKHPTFGYGSYKPYGYPSSGYETQGYPNFVYKKLYNVTDFKGYAPQINNVKHKYKIAVKKPKPTHRRKSQKLEKLVGE